MAWTVPFVHSLRTHRALSLYSCCRYLWCCLKFLVLLEAVLRVFRTMRLSSEAVTPGGAVGLGSSGGRTWVPGNGGGGGAGAAGVTLSGSAEVEGGRRAQGTQGAPPAECCWCCGGALERNGGAPEAPGVVLGAAGAGAPPARSSSSSRRTPRRQPRPTHHPGHMSSVLVRPAYSDPRLGGAHRSRHMALHLTTDHYTIYLTPHH